MNATVTLGVLGPGHVVTIGKVAIADIPLIDLPDHPQDLVEWLAAFSANLGAYPLNASLSSLIGHRVKLRVDREHLGRDVQLLREVVDLTNELLGDLTLRRLNRGGGPAADADVRWAVDEEARREFNRALGYGAPC
jgi:hypothetical protein